MTDFSLNPTFQGQHQPNVIQRLKPWARTRASNMDMTAPTLTIPGASASGTSVGFANATGGKTPYTYALTNNDGGNFSITAAGEIKTAKATPPITPTGLHNVVVQATDAASNVYTETFAITVT